MNIFKIIYSVFVPAISLIISIVAATFTGLTWRNAEKALAYVKAKEAPDLWMEKDLFVYDRYEITQLSQWNQPTEIPPKTVVLQKFPIMDNVTKNLINRECIIFNSSQKHSSSDRIDNYSGIFGEIYFKNRGILPIKEIETTKCHFKMRKNTGYNLKDFDLATQGKLIVDMNQDTPLTIFIAYLFDNDAHRLCDSQYMLGDKLNAEVIQKKKMYNDQLRCDLPVIIDLYEELTFTFKITAQGGSVYEQEHTVQIEMNGNNGKYLPDAKKVVLISD